MKKLKLTESIYTAFDAVGDFINSLAFVILVMLFILAAGTFFSHTFFYRAFPSDLDGKFLASWLLAAGWEFTILISTANTGHVKKWIPVAFSVCSGIILLFFLNAFDTEILSGTDAEGNPVFLEKGFADHFRFYFAGLLIGGLNYVYADLFQKKWIERKYNVSLPGLFADLEKNFKELQSKLDELQGRLNQSDSKITDLKKANEELARYKAGIEKKLTCPHCGQLQEFGSLTAHKGHCLENPKNKLKTKV